MMNSCFIMGRLTRDPELRRTKSGIAVTSFTLAVEDDYQEKDAQEKDVDFIDCVAWKQRGEMVAKYFTKGRMAVVNGKLKIRSFTDKEGNKRRCAEIVVDNIYFADSKKNDQAPDAQKNGYGAAPENGYGTPAQYGAPAAAPQNGGYGAYGAPAAAPQNGGYGSVPGAPAAAPQNGGYGSVPGAPAVAPQNGGYGSAPGAPTAAPGVPAGVPNGVPGNQSGTQNPAYRNWANIPDIDDGPLPF